MEVSLRISQEVKHQARKANKIRRGQRPLLEKALRIQSILQCILVFAKSRGPKQADCYHNPSNGLSGKPAQQKTTSNLNSGGSSTGSEQPIQALFAPSYSCDDTSTSGTMIHGMKSQRTTIGQLWLVLGRFMLSIAFLAQVFVAMHRFDLFD